MKYVGFMKWNLYNKDNPNTWPQIDCPMVVCKFYGDAMNIEVCSWDRRSNQFYDEIDSHYFNYNECYYAYIGYVPSGYKTRNVTKCTGNTDCEWCDNGYCLLRESCKQQKEVDEYRIEEKSIWKEFE